MAMSLAILSAFEDVEKSLLEASQGYDFTPALKPKPQRDDLKKKAKELAKKHGLTKIQASALLSALNQLSLSSLDETAIINIIISMITSIKHKQAYEEQIKQYQEEAFQAHQAQQKQQAELQAQQKIGPIESLAVTLTPAPAPTPVPVADNPCIALDEFDKFEENKELDVLHQRPIWMTRMSDELFEEKDSSPSPTRANARRFKELKFKSRSEDLTDEERKEYQKLEEYALLIKLSMTAKLRPSSEDMPRCALVA